MDPITTSIVTALVSGAVAVTKDVASSAIKDAYNSLKNWIRSKCKKAVPIIDDIEEDPNDRTGQEFLAKRLEEGGHINDSELQNLAKKLIDLITELKKEPKTEALFDFGKLEVAQKLIIKNIETNRQIMHADEAKVHDDFIIDGIKTKSKESNNLK